MHLGLHIGPSIRLEQRTEQIDPVEGARRLYSRSEKVTVELDYGSKTWDVEVAMVTVAELESVLFEEAHSGNFGSLLFITEKVPDGWRRFAVFHAMAESKAKSGKDKTGTAKHYQAIAVELGYAKVTLSSEEFARYLAWRIEIERTEFFELDFESIVTAIGERFSEVFNKMNPALESHKEV